MNNGSEMKSGPVNSLISSIEGRYFVNVPSSFLIRASFLVKSDSFCIKGLIVLPKLQKKFS